MKKNSHKFYLKQKAGDVTMTIIIAFGLIFVIGFGLIMIMQNDSGKRPLLGKNVTKQIFDSYLVETGKKPSVFYTLSSDKESLDKNEQVNITINLVTTGDEFDTACAVVEWDPQKLKFVSARPAEMPGNEQAMSVFVKGDKGRRIMCMFVPQTTVNPQNMMTIAGTSAGLYTLTLEALEARPKTTIQLSDGIGDQLVHFVDSGITNSVQLDYNNKDHFYIKIK
jgi:hypothetical protein